MRIIAIALAVLLGLVAVHASLPTGPEPEPFEASAEVLDEANSYLEP